MSIYINIYIYIYLYILLFVVLLLTLIPRLLIPQSQTLLRTMFCFFLWLRCRDCSFWACCASGGSVVSSFPSPWATVCPVGTAPTMWGSGNDCNVIKYCFLCWLINIEEWWWWMRLMQLLVLTSLLTKGHYLPFRMVIKSAFLKAFRFHKLWKVTLSKSKESGQRNLAIL